MEEGCSSKLVMCSNNVGVQRYISDGGWVWSPNSLGRTVFKSSFGMTCSVAICH